MDLRDSWEVQAEQWIKWARTPGHDSYWRYHRDQFIRLLPPPGKQTVDVGCGEGRLTRHLKELGHVVVGIDASAVFGLASAARRPSAVVRQFLNHVRRAAKVQSNTDGTSKAHVSNGSGRQDRKRLEGSGACYLPTVTPAVERKASLRLVAFMSSRTCLVRTVVCPGTSRIGSALGDESRLAL